MRALTLTAAAILGLGALAAGPVAIITPVQAAPKEVDPAELEAAFQKRWKKVLKDSAKEYGKLQRYCDKNGLEWTGNRVYRRAFDYLPNDKDLREYFGYEKMGGVWIQSDLAKENFRTNYIDEQDPNGKKFTKALSRLEKKLAGWFTSVARKCMKHVEEDPANAEKWKKRAEEAYMRVINVPAPKKLRDAAHKALKHPKFGGKYVTPFQLRYMEVRAERKQRGETLHAKDFPAQGIEMSGPLVAAGLTGGGAKSEHIEIHTTHGQEVAIRLAKMVERAIEDSIETYGYPEAVKERPLLKSLHIVKDQEEFKKALKSAGQSEAQIQRYIDLGIGGTGIGPGMYISTNSAGKDSDDAVMNIIQCLSLCRAARRMAIQDVGSPAGDDVEDWLWQTTGYDCTKRVLGSAILVWAQFGKYGRTNKPRPGQDVWIELARMQVELDDDIPLQRLYRLQMSQNQFKGPEVVKSYAFFNYLFEDDAEKARRFLWHALAQGTPRAAYNVYGADIIGADRAGEDVEVNDPTGQSLPPVFAEVLDGLDAKYRKWLMDGWSRFDADGN